MTTIFFTDSVLANSTSSAEGVLLDYRVSHESRLALESLRERGARAGVIVQLGGQSQGFVEKVFNRSNLFSFFDPKLIIYSDGFTEQTLVEAVAKAKAAPGRALFVGEHCTERAPALRAGFEAAIPHPSLAPEVMDGGALTYARVSGLNDQPINERLKSFVNMPVVPLHLTVEGQGSAYIITSTRIAELIRGMGFEVLTFGNAHDPQVTDLYLVHDDRNASEKDSIDFLARQGKARFIVSQAKDALLLALPPDVSIEKIHFPNALHGHNQRLLANPSLIKLLIDTDPTESQWLRPKRFTKVTLSEAELKVLRDGITDKSLQRLHAPYVGHVQLDSSGLLVRSRHIAHSHNARVTEALCSHLKQIGGSMMSVQRHNFILGGVSLSNIEAELPGSDPESFVLLSAHFDSTASMDSDDYDPTKDSAPGGDDDASGVAAVLAAAEVAMKLRASGQLKRTLRFVLFNAEEDHILGSQKYAQAQFDKKAKIRAVFQMDMIGFSGGSSREFEVHAGFPDNSDTEKRSLELARTINEVVAQVSTFLRGPQIYPSQNASDPAYGRSDHTCFQRLRYAACMISEDYNTDLGDPDPDPHINPDYHRKSDKGIDYVYAAEIARIVVAAAILTAKR